MMLAWGARVSPTFRSKVVALCARRSIAEPSWLMACMAFETGLTFDPAKRNPASGATGLIQFMPSTARQLGTTTDALAQKTAEDQLDDVERYFGWQQPIHSLPDCYMAILWPAAVGKPDDTVIFASGRDAYLLNRGLDLNKDGEVTKAEATAKVAALLEEGLKPENAADAGAEAEAAPQLQPESPQPAEAPMGALALPFLQAILQGLISKFGQQAQQKINAATGVSPEATAAFFQNLMGQVGAAAGIPVTDQTSAIQAVAAVTKPEAAPKIAQLEQDSLDYLERLSPFIDKIAKYEQMAWEAEESSRDAAAARSARQAEGPLWNNPTFIIAAIIMALVAGVVFSVLYKDAMFPGIVGFSTDMQAFVIGAIVGGALTAVVGFYLGSSRSSAAKDVVLGQIAKAK